MRLLISCGLYHPAVGGAEEVCRRLAEAMVQAGHDVTVATGLHADRSVGVDGTATHNGVAIQQFDITGNWALGMRGDVRAYQEFLLGGGFDVTFHYAAQIWSTDLVLPLLGRLPAPAVLAPCGYSGLSDPRYGRYFARLGSVLPGFAAVIHHSDVYQDAHFATEAGVHHCVTIGNAIDTGEFDRVAGQDPAADFRQLLGIGDRRIVLSVSNHTGGKGHDLVIAAFQAAAASDAVLLLVGGDSPDGCLAECRAAASEDPRILILEGLPRERVVQTFHAADVFMLGSQVECSPLVLLEAMAAGLPWISTPVGNVRELSGGIVCAAQSFPERLRALLQDARQRQALGALGRKATAMRPTLAEVHRSYERMLTLVADNPQTAVPVPAERLAADIDRIAGLEALGAGDPATAMIRLRAAIDRDPTAPGLRPRLLQAMLLADAWSAVDAFDLLADELELTPWIGELNLALFFIAGALGTDLVEAATRAEALGLPVPDLMQVAARGRNAGSHDVLRSGLRACLGG